MKNRRFCIRSQKTAERHWRFAASALISAFLVLAVMPYGSQATPGQWSYTGALDMDRKEFTSTLLPDGKVLLTGGYLYPPWTINNYAILYDSMSGSFNLTGPMAEARLAHQATLLNSGDVLVTGGVHGSPDDLSYSSTAELYSPVLGTFTFTQGPMGFARCGHTSTLLLNGQVLITGGYNQGWGTLNSAELYDPATKTFTATNGPMAQNRETSAAIRLLNGKVLIMGGYDRGTPDHYLDTAELYDPVSGTFNSAGKMTTSRYGATATLLPDGRVLLTGGAKGGEHLNTAEIFDPSLGQFYATGSMQYKRLYHTATLLVNGKVLATGGYSGLMPDWASITAEIYDPALGSFTLAASPLIGRINHTAARLFDGRVLVAGGENHTDFRAELYEPLPPPQVNLPALLAFFPFEGDARDVSGNCRHGTLSGSPQLVPGYQGQAYAFNTNPSMLADYISIPLNINSGNYPRLTMGAWVKPLEIGSVAPFLTHDDGGYDRQVGLDTRGGGIGWSAFCGPVGQVLGAVPGFTGAWTFVAVMYNQNAQTVKLQVDDMVLTKMGVVLGEGQNQLYIGASPLFSTLLAGVVDNVFIFGDVLSDEQLAYIRTRGVRAFLKPGLDPLLLLLGD